jgi:hypothetical protein
MNTATTRADVGTWRRQRAWELHQVGPSSWVVAKGHRRRVGSQPRGSQLMDQTRTRRWRGGVAHATTPCGPSQAHGRAVGADSGPLGPRSAGLWISWRRVGSQTHSRSALADVWSPVPSRPCQPFAAPGGLECAAPHPAGDPTRRGSHSSVARGALARQQKKAVEEGYTIVWVEESGFYLLRMRSAPGRPRARRQHCRSS